MTFHNFLKDKYSEPINILPIISEQELLAKIHKK
jgi:hypothetical protein